MAGTYAPEENRFAQPFAEQLATNSAFRAWVLRKTFFSEHAHNARLLSDEMAKRRSPKARTWWGSHFTESCRCVGCSGHETDILAVFENNDGDRFALHIEVKHPGDKFHPGQAAAYPMRAKCWSTDGQTPKMVLPHRHAATVLLCSKTRLVDFAQHLPHFDTVITFEDIHESFPGASPSALVAS